MDFDPGELSSDEEILAEFADTLSSEDDPSGWNEEALELKHAAEEVVWQNTLGEDRDSQDEIEEEVELDSMGNPIFLAAAGGFGYEMAQGEIDERQIAENILKNKARKVESVKVPLSHRHNQKKRGYMTPFGRWVGKVNKGLIKSEDEIEYTIEERLQIMDSEGDWDD